MARKFLTNIDLNLSELQNAIIQNLASDPTTGNADGRIYYNTAADELRVYANGVWIAVGSGDINGVLGTANEIEVTVVDGIATISLPATINAATTGNAATATKLETTRAIELSGDITGTANFDGSAAINISTTIAANSVALGTDTSGDYVTSVSASDGIAATGTGEGATVALTNTDKGSSQNIFKNVSDGTTSVVADSNNDTLTISAGTGVSVTANASTDTLTVANTGVTAIAGTTNQITASGSTGSVTLSLPSAVTFPGTVTLNADPTQALHAATKQYVDEVAEGLSVKQAAEIATTANLDATYDNGASGVGATLTGTSNGAFPTIDGVTITSIITGANGILVKNQSSTLQNGRYNLTQLGDSEEPWILTRCGLCNESDEIPGMYVFVKDGTLGEGTGWVAVVSDPATFVIGTDPIVFTQFSGAGTYTAGNGLTLSGTQFSINTGITVDLSTAQTLTNKTLTSPVISGLYLSDNNIIVEGTNDTNETTLVFTDPTQDNTITFKDATGTVAFTGDITSAINALTTSDIEEGTNLYYTDERAQDSVGNNLSGSNSLSAVYTDSAGTFAFDTTLATTSYMSKSSGLAVDISALEVKLLADSFTRKYSASVGGATSVAVTHNLGSRDVTVEVYDNTTYDTVECDVVRTNTNTVTVSFSTAPSANAYRVVVTG
jgi:hypothetical protein